jgi:hypothetical protein
LGNERVYQRHIRLVAVGNISALFLVYPAAVVKQQCPAAIQIQSKIEENSPGPVERFVLKPLYICDRDLGKGL